MIPEPSEVTPHGIPETSGEVIWRLGPNRQVPAHNPVESMPPVFPELPNHPAGLASNERESRRPP